MCKEIKRTFRPAHRDVEVIYEDDLGVEKFLYIALPDDVQKRIEQHFAEEDEICERVRKAAP